MKIIGRAHVFGDLINTDIHCSSKYLSAQSSPDDVMNSVFAELKPGFAIRVNKGDIIVAGRGFGTVSSREEAPELMRRLGIAAVLAKSFGYLFYRNAINIGLPLIECNTDMIGDLDQISVDLVTGNTYNLSTNVDVLSRTRYSSALLRILEDGGLFQHIKKNSGYAL